MHERQGNKPIARTCGARGGLEVNLDRTSSLRNDSDWRVPMTTCALAKVLRISGDRMSANKSLNTFLLKHCEGL